MFIFDRSLQYCAIVNGGAEEDRTPDLLRARQVLSQLSYGPFAKSLKESRARSYCHQVIILLLINEMVGLGGFEPPTSPLSGVRSNQLSYRPKLRACSSQKRRTKMSVSRPLRIYIIK